MSEGISTSSGAIEQPRLTREELKPGVRVGLYTLVAPIKRGGQWLCRCACGQEKVVVAGYLIKGLCVSCGCKKRRHPVLEAGQTFGQWRLVALDLARTDHGRRWICVCTCGTQRSVCELSLNIGETRSCGCGRKKEISSVKYHKEYKAWYCMIDRCTNPRARNWKNYGGRGITVCARWLTSFANFFADVGLCPTDRGRLTLERCDNERGYTPDNVVWANYKAQSRNRRNNRRVTHDGRTQTVADWAAELGVPRCRIIDRLDAGWSIERALFAPPQVKRPPSVGTNPRPTRARTSPPGTD
jgi:hypothetical protein